MADDDRTYGDVAQLRATGDEPTTEGTGTAADSTDSQRVSQLEAENRRLRTEYLRDRESDHRRTALGLLIVGTVALLAAVVFADSRTVLLALGFTGLFGAVLTYFLTPEQFIAAEIGECVYAATANNGDRAVGELGLQGTQVYVPARDEDDAPVWLFVPNAGDYVVPDRSALDALFVVTEDDRERGVSFSPTGGSLYRQFSDTLADDIVDDPAEAADQLADTLVEAFELVGSATAQLDRSGGRVRMAITDSAYGPVDRFDHPVVSFFAVGMAVALDRPVVADATKIDDEHAEYVVTCEWDAAE